MASEGEKVYRVAWRSLLTGATGHGAWHESKSRPMLEEAALAMDRKYAGMLVHRIEAAAAGEATTARACKRANRGDRTTKGDGMDEIEDLRDRIRAAVEVAVKYGGIDGDHHKAWVIDQMVRALAEDRYYAVVADACMGRDGAPDTYTWDTGTPP